MPGTENSLAAHTPSQGYFTAAVRRRALQLLGADAKYVNTVAPEPYKSDYPFSPKVIDSIITLALDPLVKPLSLQGNLDRLPALKKLAKELADRDYFRKYPGGGIGAGGGPGGDGDGAGATSGDTGGADAGAVGGTAAAVGADAEAASVGLGTSGLGSPSAAIGGGTSVSGEADPDAVGGAKATAADLSAAARASTPTFSGMLGFGKGGFNLGDAISTALGVLGSMLGLTGLGAFGSGVGLGVNAANSQAQALANATGRSVSDAMAALASMAQGVSASDAASGVSSAQGGGAAGPATMTPESLQAGAARVAAPTSPVSAGTRSNAAARVGGGISPSFLEVLEGLRG